MMLLHYLLRKLVMVVRSRELEVEPNLAAECEIPTTVMRDMAPSPVLLAHLEELIGKVDELRRNFQGLIVLRK